MPGKLTSIVVADRTVGDQISVWESLESASGVADEMILVDIGMDESSTVAVDEFRRLKRCCPVISYDNIYEMIHNITFDTEWCIVMFADEIIHEESRHYIWDLADRHSGDYDGASLPIHVVYASWDGFTSTGMSLVHDDIRMMDVDILRGLEWDGVKFNARGDLNLAPPQLCPRPIWKLQMAFPCHFLGNKGEQPFKFGEEQYAAAPERVRRLMGRGRYTPPYLFGSGQKTETEIEHEQCEGKR